MKTILKAALITGFICGPAIVQAQTVVNSVPAGDVPLPAGANATQAQVFDSLPPGVQANVVSVGGQLYIPKSDVHYADNLSGAESEGGIAAGSTTNASGVATGSIATIVALGTGVFAIIGAIVAGATNNGSNGTNGTTVTGTTHTGG